MDNCRVRAVKWNMVPNQPFYTEKSNGIHGLHTTTVYTSMQCFQADCVYLLSSSYSKRSSSSTKRNKLHLTKVMQSIYQRHFHMFVDWRNIYLTIFKGRAMKNI